MQTSLNLLVSPSYLKLGCCLRCHKNDLPTVFLPRSKLFEENKMQCLWHRFASDHSRHRTPQHLAGIAFLIALHALLIVGFAVGTATFAAAQPSIPSSAPSASEPSVSGPSASNPGFLPAKPIRHLNRFPPYPRDSVQRREEGTVLVKLTINADGRVNEVLVVQSSGSARLDKTTTSWIKSRWRYLPATLNGQPTVSTTTLKVVFVLKK